MRLMTTWKKRLTGVVLAVMMSFGTLLPKLAVYADEAQTQSQPAADAAAAAAAQQAADAAAAAAAQQAAAQAHAAALAVDLRGFLGQNPDTAAAAIGGFAPYSGMLDGSYYTDGSVEFWGTAAQGIRSVQIISATTANIAGVTFGSNYDQAVALLKSSGWTQMHTGGRRTSFRDRSGNLLSVGYTSRRAVFWLNYLKIY